MFEVACIAALHPERLGPSPDWGGGGYLSMLAPGSVTIDPTGEVTGWPWENGCDPYAQHQYFPLQAKVSKTVVSKYGRYGYIYSNGGCPKLETAGPVTAWTWLPKKD